MRVSVGHRLGAPEARRRIDTIVDRLVARAWSGSVVVNRPERRWDGNRLVFSLDLVRGVFSTTVAGHVELGEGLATIEVAIPALVEAFIGRDRIRSVLERELGAALQ